ncbi:hypothetical protein ACFVAF_34740 [Streptomyces sp. NPDC057596]|uniref:hypothetical protein n=1 Tax=unclassified Streptomyces TaxID=2593676 RepID=UPI003444456F
MQQLPSITAARAIAAAQAAAESTDPALAECLGAIGDLVERTGDPEAVFAWIRRVFSREDLRMVAAQHSITVHETRAPAEEQPPETIVIWTATGGLAIAPQGQHPADTLTQLRAAIAERDEEQRLAADFQATAAAQAAR